MASEELSIVQAKCAGASSDVITYGQKEGSTCCNVEQAEILMHIFFPLNWQASCPSLNLGGTKTKVQT